MSSNSGESDASESLQRPRGRKRTRNEASWKKNSVKVLHDAGQEYVSRSTGKLVPARSVGPSCGDCCFGKLGKDVVDALFSGYWGLGDYDKQTAYIQSLVSTNPTKDVVFLLGRSPQ